MRELIDRQAALDAIKFAELGREYDEVEKVQIFNPWHRVEYPPKEEGRYWCAKKFAGHWIFLAAWYWNNVSDYTGVPVGEEEKADGFVFGEDVVYPDYWMPIDPPKEDA